MSAKRKLTMRQLRHMLQLARDGASTREIARVLGVARSTVQENLKHAEDAGLGWPLPGDLTDDALEGRLFARAGVKPGARRRPEPSWADLVVELKKPGVTMMLLWAEYFSCLPEARAGTQTHRRATLQRRSQNCSTPPNRPFESA